MKDLNIRMATLVVVMVDLAAATKAIKVNSSSPSLAEVDIVKAVAVATHAKVWTSKVKIITPRY